jgi:hypothetical protein
MNDESGLPLVVVLLENRRLESPHRLATLATLSPKGARAVVRLFSCSAVKLVHTQDCAGA